MNYKTTQSEIINQVCELSLDYKIKVKAKDRPVADGPERQVKIFRSLYGDEIELYERCYAMLMNNRFQCLGIICIGEGDTKRSVLGVRRMIQAAMLCNATVVSICHNHPSGLLNPSRDDLDITNGAKNACKIMGLHLADSIIISDEGYYSFMEEGKL